MLMADASGFESKPDLGAKIDVDKYLPRATSPTNVRAQAVLLPVKVRKKARYCKAKEPSDCRRMQEDSESGSDRIAPPPEVEEETTWRRPSRARPSP